MTRMSSFLLAFLFLGSDAHAVTFDWASNAWASGAPSSLSNSYNFDAANAGNDITISMSGNTSAFRSGYPTTVNNSGYTYSGGFSGGRLNNVVNFTTNTQSILYDFVLNYASGVGSLSFTLHDVDIHSDGVTWQDRVSSIQGVDMSNNIVSASIVTSVGNTLVSGGVQGTAAIDNLTSGANVTISFSTPIKSFSFVYGSGPSAQSNPGEQGIGIGNITYTPVVPEPATVLAGGTLLTLLYRRSRKDKVSAPLVS